ncbi:helicase associated domain-containing protein [Streptomyces lydicus]|uniref:helicase associated domain-containing protein n=2 Tax=Streptomyces lydicus TaxID=47763 RepID=UPI000C5C4319
MIWEHRDAAWQRNLKALAAYQRQHGDTLVPQRYEHEGIRLGAWVSQMRAKYAAGALPSQRIADLEQAGMVWRHDEHWLRKRALSAAASWHRQHGNLDMPSSTRHEGVALGAWLARQRRAHAAGELPGNIVDALTRLGMVWQPPPRKKPDRTAVDRARREKAWERGYSAAQKYASEHGHLRVPDGLWSDGLRLDAWLSRQRAARRAGNLPDERIAALSALGIRW